MAGTLRFRVPGLIVRALVALILILGPRAASACAVCLDSAYGNRGFSVAFVGLMLAPFAVATGFASVVVWGYMRRSHRRGG